jgi:endonuclease/exonuclease/phosphatase family metal-dependent hydrolase
MRILKKILRAILIVILAAVIGFAGLITYAVITDYKPGETEIVYNSENTVKLTDTVEISLLIWNIGYCGMDNEMDFFYDGGKSVFTPEDSCIKNLVAVKSFLKQNSGLDFYLIQEVDKGSKRSYYINEYDSLTRSLKGYSSYFGKNYDVFFVPVPPATPMGKVLSGLATFSKYQPSSSIRYAFPGEYGFPKQLFMLDRCFLVNRYPLEGGKELLVINTHNEAFDPGQIRKAQMAYLKDFLLNEYSKGNYIITGGDWNQTPPDFKPVFVMNKTDTTQMVIPSDYLPSEWKWLYDSSIPSERNVVKAYDQASTPTTIFDFFLISPNVEALSVEGVQLNFENSDHNPVRIKVKLHKTTMQN